jgi:hypothetical protein
MISAPVSLLQEVFDAHGGIDRWRAFSGVASTIVTSGMLWKIKGVDLDNTPRRATSEFRRQWTKIAPFGAPDWTMTWMPERVEIIDGGGEVIAERADGRNAFDRSYHAPWDPLNLAYFNGYAMWTYHATPLVFAESGYEVRETEPVRHEGELLRGLSVEFPADIHSHARNQRFYFGTDGLLKRHDYEVEVWANMPATHFLSDYVDVDGLKFPSRRRVYVREPDGRPNLLVNLVNIDLADYSPF